MNECCNPGAVRPSDHAPEPCGGTRAAGAGCRPAAPASGESRGGLFKTLWRACCGPAAGEAPQSPQSPSEPKEPTHER